MSENNSIKYIGKKGTPAHLMTEMRARLDDMEGIVVAVKFKDGSYEVLWSMMDDTNLVFLNYITNQSVSNAVINNLGSQVIMN